jgi:hypothetical protein
MILSLIASPPACHGKTAGAYELRKTAVPYKKE